MPVGYSFSPHPFSQQNLRSRVSYTTLTDNEANHYSYATFYSYDIHGNVNELLNDYYGLQSMTNNAGGAANHYKHITYDYDLISGKVNQVNYQPDQPDAFYHRYSYDAENRLTKAETSRDKVYWEEDANYLYYRHGPLARTVLGKMRVQGIDYAYTLQGWLKAVNPVYPNSGGTGGNGTGCGPGTGLDVLDVDARQPVTPTNYVARNTINFNPGFESGDNGDAFEAYIDASLTLCNSNSATINDQDGVDFSYSTVCRDVYKYTLNYYNTDYRSIGGGASPSMMVPGQLGADNRPLYNGNISSMGVSVAKFNQPMLYNYQYDQLNRLVSMDAWKAGTDVWNNLIKTDEYKERVSYDPNGNILSYVRNGNTPRGVMDNMSYAYKPTTNQLDKVDDGAPDLAANQYSNYNDIKQGQTSGNYTYDEIGNLTKDVSEGITNIEWTVYGKIKKVTKSTGTIEYTYDAAGNRISKTANNKTTVYVRDASGNVMSVYEKTGSSATTQIETDLYGSSRLGLQTAHTVPDVNITLANGDIATLSTFTRGEKIFELSNHLGNVLVTVNDRKVQHTTDNSTVDYWEADVVSANDYYPFGMSMTGRGYNAGSYRYGFNGKEDDNDITNGGQDYGMRIYDKRLGRFLSVDPLTKKYPELSPYQFAGDRPIDGIDLDGLEWRPSGRYGPNQLASESTSVQIIPAHPMVIEKNNAQILENKVQQIAAQAIANAPVLKASPKVVTQQMRQARREHFQNPETGAKTTIGKVFESRIYERINDNLVEPIATQMAAEGVTAGFFALGKSLLYKSPSAIARGWQGKGVYTGVDTWRDITLSEGKFVAGALPGQSNFYTTFNGLNRSGLSQEGFMKGLQVAKGGQGWRDAVGIYRVSENTSAAFGTTYANPTLGAGGLPQIFIPATNKLELIKIIPLKAP
ncbi:MAG: hypothetical protein H7329_02750 [Opitutaceae bacterium]|nr:hypothetical protein [Cytophagales bacterium]